MNNNIIISVAYFADNKEVQETILRSDYIRNETLKKCYEIKGYKDLSLSDKNKIYDKVRNSIVQKQSDEE